MRTFFAILTILCSLHFVSSDDDPFQGIFQQGRPCFDTIESSQCNTSLAQSFRHRSPNATNDKPDTFAFLFTPSSPDAAELLHKCGGRLPPGSTYDPKADTEIIIHGWIDGVCRSAWMREFKEQIFQRAKTTNIPYNVILIDWTWGNFPDYYVASENCKIVGEQVGFIINNIMERTGIGPEKFHLIGNGFGTISTGFTGRSVRGLRRITALDPPYAPYGFSPPNQRLTYRDARIVDIIHTNALDCFALAIGDRRQLGHADFYPNGGLIQTSCYRYMFESLLKGDILYALVTLDPRLCYHTQSLQYYKVSINPDGCEFVGVESRSYQEFLSRPPGTSETDWAVMGMDYELYHRNDGRRKKYYLKTSNFCPYYDDSYLGESQFPFNTTCHA